ncbi:MAG: exodeoxyribonuclease III [Candidatus Paceibacterota bacterium]
MNIISWNVNGIRALERRGQFKWLLLKKPDIFCLQETKSHPEQLSSALTSPPGYYAYFSSHTFKKGYSGTALYTMKEPDSVLTGIGVEEFDAEGRIIIALFGSLLVINVYFPNGGGGPERLNYKLRFYDAFLNYCSVQRAKGFEIILMGDVNTAHEEIDLARPKANEKNTGFLPEERAWVDELVRSGFVDAFRAKYPSKVDSYTYWDQKTFARERNVGWRIDYFFLTPKVASVLIDVVHHTGVSGSDHCPLELVIKDIL